MPLRTVHRHVQRCYYLTFPTIDRMPTGAAPHTLPADAVVIYLVRLFWTFLRRRAALPSPQVCLRTVHVPRYALLPGVCHSLVPIPCPFATPPPPLPFSPTPSHCTSITHTCPHTFTFTFLAPTCLPHTMPPFHLPTCACPPCSVSVPGFWFLALPRAVCCVTTLHHLIPTVAGLQHFGCTSTPARHYPTGLPLPLPPHFYLPVTFGLHYRYLLHFALHRYSCWFITYPLCRCLYVCLAVPAAGGYACACHCRIAWVLGWTLPPSDHHLVVLPRPLPCLPTFLPAATVIIPI